MKKSNIFFAIYATIIILGISLFLIFYPKFSTKSDYATKISLNCPREITFEIGDEIILPENYLSVEPFDMINDLSIEIYTKTTKTDPENLNINNRKISCLSTGFYYVKFIVPGKNYDIYDTLVVHVVEKGSLNFISTKRPIIQNNREFAIDDIFDINIENTYNIICDQENVKIETNKISTTEPTRISLKFVFDFEFYQYISNRNIISENTLSPDPIDPPTPVIPEDPVEPENPEIPVDPEDPTTPETPVDPEIPTNPEDPIDPETPIEPEIPDEPISPNEPENPDTPTDPDNPIDPNEPEIPIDPEDPTEPETPVEPESPEDPEDPTDPEIPEEPTDPIEPEGPIEPETPTDPNEPENPTNPNEPTEPENPTEPDVPIEPETPEDPDIPSDIYIINITGYESENITFVIDGTRTLFKIYYEVKYNDTLCFYQAITGKPSDDKMCNVTCDSPYIYIEYLEIKGTFTLTLNYGDLATKTLTITFE